MSIQVVADQCDLAGLWVIDVQQMLDFLRPVDPRPTVPATRPPPSREGVEKHENSLGPSAFVMVVLSLGVTGDHWQGWLFISQQLFAGFVHANQRLFVRILGGVGVENSLHL